LKGTSRRNERRGATGMPPAAGRARPASGAPATKPSRGPRTQRPDRVDRSGDGGKPARAAEPGSSGRQGLQPFVATGADSRAAVAAAVDALHYELVDVERSGRGLLRVTIDRLPGRAYAEPGAFVTVGDCEAVTRQLQYALEVEGVDYARLEVSSPGLDRPLRSAADFERFAGERVRLALKEPFAGRKHFEGLLGRADDGACTLVFEDGKSTQVLGFTPQEVREARLVPVVDFKGRRSAGSGTHDGSAATAGRDQAGPRASTDEEEVIG
jgi:ribosome maturation factor RimP